MSDEFPHPVPESLAEMIAERFRILGDPTRIRLIDALRDGPLSGRELQEATGHSQQNVSKHLRTLFQAGMVDRTQDGTSARYSVTDEGVFELCEHVCGGLRRRVDQLGAVVQGERA